MENVEFKSIMKLRPTQSGLGMEEVYHKVKQIKEMKSHELEEYINQKVVPVVIGPNGELYLIDHHHYAYSMHLAGHNEVKVNVIKNLSHLSVDDFWAEMINKKWAWLYLPNGKPIGPKKLPTSLTKLSNDYYRSLAWGVREQKGFNLSADKVPFFEFMWGSYFRKYLTEDLIKNDFSLATHFALKLSSHDLAKSLPGYKGE
jgi:hypothetical protein